MQQIESHKVRRLYQRIANLVHWHPPSEHFQAQKLDELSRMEDLLPSGSGFDAGCKIQTNSVPPNRVLITFEYHHMSGIGYYIGWTQHEVLISPNLHHDYHIDIIGTGYEDLDDCYYEFEDDEDTVYRKTFEDDSDYFYEVFQDCLDMIVFTHREYEQEYSDVKSIKCIYIGGELCQI